jgi:mono/diheme cytochrome c family protein
MRITTTGLKKLIAAVVGVPALALALMSGTPVLTSAAVEDDAAAVYKAKCAMCHGQKAEKSFDMAKTDEQHVEAIMKGIKPKMPAYESKGITADQAKALVAYMKSLKQ